MQTVTISEYDDAGNLISVETSEAFAPADAGELSRYFEGESPADIIASRPQIVYVLATYGPYDDLEVDVYETREQAENGFMGWLYECYQDFDLPSFYEESYINDWLDSINQSLNWSITEQTVIKESR
jgi:hypothetical protein